MATGQDLAGAGRRDQVRPGRKGRPEHRRLAQHPPPLRDHAPIGCSRPLCAGACGGQEVGRRSQRGLCQGPSPLPHRHGRVVRLRRGGGCGGRHHGADRRRCAEAEGQVAVEVHRPRHADGRQLRLEHRRRHLRRRHQHPRHEDRRRGALAGLPRQGEVVRRHRGAQGTGRRAGDRDSGARRRHAGAIPGARRHRGDRHQHLVRARRAGQARHRLGRRPERQA